MKRPRNASWRRKELDSVQAGQEVCLVSEVTLDAASSLREISICGVGVAE